MKTYSSYPAFFYLEPDGISIEFPDLPGCLSCARSEEEAFQRAREALGLYLYGMETDGEVIPEPSNVGTLQPEEGGTLCMVEVYMPAVRERINNN